MLEFGPGKSATLHARAANGKRATITVSTEGGEGFDDLVMDALLAGGFSRSELSGVVVALTPPADFSDAASSPPPAGIHLLDKASLSAGTPPIPQPPNAYTLPASPSPGVTISNTAVVPHISLGKGTTPITTFPSTSYHPPFPSYSDNTVGATLLYTRYWEAQHSQITVGPQTYNHAVTATYGVDTTNSTSFSASLGVSVAGLSASLSETTSTSVTVSSSTSVTDTVNIVVPSGQTCVFTYWQLVEQFTFVFDTTPISWDGKVYVEFIRLSGNFPNNTLKNPTNNFASDPVYFDT